MLGGCSLRLLLRRPNVRVLSSLVRTAPQLTTDLRQHLSHLLEQYHGLQDKANDCGGGVVGGDHYNHLYQQIASLEPVAKLTQELQAKEQEMKELQDMLESGGEDGALRELASEEQQSCQKEMQYIERRILQALVPHDAADQHSAILEVRAGAGGREASLFTAEIFQMYQKFSAYKQWKFEVLEVDISEVGGYKHASASVNGKGVFGAMKHESGVHRVQRIPITEGAGRVHTSTMSVAILPQPSEIEVEVSPNDVKVETHRSSGPGGQSVNTTDSAVRLTHIPSGIVVHIQDDRSQHKNRSRALKILRARLFEKKREEAELSQRKERKQQIGSGERHERIRTYQYLQDRVTDHRVGASVHGVEEFLQGREGLVSIVEQLQAEEEARTITRLLTNHQRKKPEPDS